ncbi:GAF domain-containing protein [Aureimonas ureilytica]|uniref:GAF domain-containing protein n=1 Tax=Aureimonas ureilytica TaxID=401562 RepID=UPI0009E71694|nr:GAF domain-containing protein [Aureimonas ureilytica]
MREPVRDDAKAQSLRSPLNEARRSAALHAYDVLDTEREEEFDVLAQMASEICGTPIGVVNFVDTRRQFFKAEVGLGVRETPLETSFCGHAILEDDLMVVPDATKDPRFESNPLITSEPGLRFYAGALVKTPDGMPIGTVCVLDYQPRHLAEHQAQMLRLLARQASTQLELRRALTKARAAETRHRNVLDSAVDYAIISLDLEGRVVGWNRGAENVLGWREEEMLGRSADVLMSATDRALGLPEQELRTAREVGRSEDERWLARKDGSRLFALTDIMPLRDPNDRHVGYVKILRDRTQDRRRGQRLALLGQLSEALLTTDDPNAALRPILESGADTIGFDQSYAYEIAADGQHLCLQQAVGVDPTLLGAFRYVSFEVPICGLVAQNGEPLVLSHLQSSEDPRFEIARAGGLDAYAGFPIFDRDTLVGVVSFVSRDTPSFDRESLCFFETVARLLSIARERLNRETTLRASEQRSRIAQDAGQIGIYELDLASGRILGSPLFWRLFGLDDAAGRTADDIRPFIVEEDLPLICVDPARRDGSTPLEVQYRIRRASDQSLRWVARRAEFIRDGDGVARAMIGTVIDVTDRKRAELHQSARLALADRLRSTESASEVYARASECLAVTLGAPRAGYGRIDRRAELFEVAEDWASREEDKLVGHYGLQLFRGTVDYLTGGQALVMPDLSYFPALAEDEPTYRAMGTLAQIVVPIIDRSELVGALYVHAKEPRLWTSDEVEFAKAVADQTYAALMRVRAEAEQQVLNLELSHRLKNTLAMVQAVAMQTLRGVTERELVEAFNRRVQALAVAHHVLLSRNWTAARIKDTVEAVLGTFDQSARFAIEGPNVELGPRSTLTLSLMMHELATNAVKYGAISVPDGRVDVSWRLEHKARSQDLVLEWREYGGPPVVAPSAKGFGSRLIGMGLAQSGSVDLRYETAGFVAVMSAPLEHLQGV